MVWLYKHGYKHTFTMECYGYINGMILQQQQHQLQQHAMQQFVTSISTLLYEWKTEKK